MGNTGCAPGAVNKEEGRRDLAKHTGQGCNVVLFILESSLAVRGHGSRGGGRCSRPLLAEGDVSQRDWMLGSGTAGEQRFPSLTDRGRCFSA